MPGGRLEDRLPPGIVEVHELGRLRPCTEEAHLAADDVPELRKLVEVPGTAGSVPTGVIAVVVRGGERDAAGRPSGDAARMLRSFHMRISRPPRPTRGTAISAAQVTEAHRATRASRMGRGRDEQHEGDEAVEAARGRAASGSPATRSVSRLRDPLDVGVAEPDVQRQAERRGRPARRTP